MGGACGGTALAIGPSGGGKVFVQEAQEPAESDCVACPGGMFSVGGGDAAAAARWAAACCTRTTTTP